MKIFICSVSLLCVLLLCCQPVELTAKNSTGENLQHQEQAKQIADLNLRIDRFTEQQQLIYRRIHWGNLKTWSNSKQSWAFFTPMNAPFNVMYLLPYSENLLAEISRVRTLIKTWKISFPRLNFMLVIDLPNTDLTPLSEQELQQLFLSKKMPLDIPILISKSTLTQGSLSKHLDFSPKQPTPLLIVVNDQGLVFHAFIGPIDTYRTLLLDTLSRMTSAFQNTKLK